MDGESNFSRAWDIVTSVMLVFVAIVTPFELGFLETRIDTSGGVALFAVNRAVDLVFFFDILVQLNTCFQDKMGARVFSRWRIFKQYARTWMLLDLVSILPLDTVDVVMSDGGESDGSLKAIRIVRLLRLMKLLRVLRGMRIFARWEARLALDYAMLSLQKFFVTLLVAAHWLGCTLMMLHQLLAPDCEMDADTSTCTFLFAYQDGTMVSNEGG